MPGDLDGDGADFFKKSMDHNEKYDKKSGTDKNNMLFVVH